MIQVSFTRFSCPGDGALSEFLTPFIGQGVLHRDIKPGNIILTEANELFIIDFGLADQADGRLENDDPMAWEAAKTVHVGGCRGGARTRGYADPERGQSGWQDDVVLFRQNLMM